MKKSLGLSTLGLIIFPGLVMADLKPNSNLSTKPLSEISTDLKGIVECNSSMKVILNFETGVVSFDGNAYFTICGGRQINQILTLVCKDPDGTLENKFVFEYDLNTEKARDYALRGINVDPSFGLSEFTCIKK